MIKRTQGLPINTIVLAIIAILVLIFLILILTGGLGRFTSGSARVGPTAQQVNSTVCSEYAATLQTSLETTTDPSAQLSLIQSSQYLQANCSVVAPTTFTLANGSVVVCNGNFTAPTEIYIPASNGQSNSGQSSSSSNGQSNNNEIPSGCYLS